MIKIFDSNDTDFSSNGNIVIEPLKCIETKKKSLNGWIIDVEVPIEYKEYILQDKLCVVKTKSKLNPQAFSIYDISYTTRKVLFKAEHVAFRSRDYFLTDCRPISLNGSAALNYINERTDNKSPFSIISDVETIDTAYFIRKNLLEAWATIEERWNGVFDFDNYNIYFMQNIGNDNGEIISYQKNLQDLRIYEDWSNVVTKLYPVGYNGLMLPEEYLTADIEYEKPYTKTISFETDLETDSQTEDNLMEELRSKAQQYIDQNKYPQVCYEIVSNIMQSVDIGDTIYVKHPLVEISTEIQEYDYDLNSKRITKLIFGNYNRDIKTKFETLKNNILNVVNKVSKQEQVILEQTNIINNLNKLGHVYIDDNEILILDNLPKENAENVLKLGLGGLGISENGVEGPFITAITGKGINADSITSGLVRTDRIEGYSQLVIDISNLEDNQVQQQSQITQTIMDLAKIQNMFQVTGGNNLIKNSQKLLDDDVWNYLDNGTYIGGYDANLIGKTAAVAKLGISNGKMSTKNNNIMDLVLGSQYTLSFKISNDENTVTTVRLIGNNTIYEETFESEIEMEERIFSFIAETSNYTLEIESNTTLEGYCYIYDLMLNKGDVITWEPAVGEIYGTVLKMSQMGLSIYCTGSEIATLMTSQGFQIRRFANGNLYEVVTEFTKDGFISKKGQLEELVVSNFDFKQINYQGYETLVLYKKESD